MKKIPFHKKKWFVASKIQRDLIIYIICLSLLSQLVLASHTMTGDEVNYGPYSDIIVIIIRVFFVGYIVYGLWLSNRMAGPLVRLKQHMDEVAEGKEDAEIQFRKNDYGLELAESFNEVVRKRFNKGSESSDKT